MTGKSISLEILAETTCHKKIDVKGQIVIPSRLRKAIKLTERDYYICASVKLKSKEERYNNVGAILIYPVNVSYTIKKTNF